MTAPTVHPVTVSQHTAPLVLGVTSRRFREMVARHGIRHVRDGKIVLVAVSDWLDAMARLATTASAAPSQAPANDADPVASVDDMLAQLGRRRAS